MENIKIDNKVIVVNILEDDTARNSTGHLLVGVSSCTIIFGAQFLSYII